MSVQQTVGEVIDLCAQQLQYQQKRSNILIQKLIYKFYQSLLQYKNKFHFYTNFYYYTFKKRCQFQYTFPLFTMTLFKIPKHMNYTQNQAFGNQQPIQHIQQQDIINSIQFDPTGQLLAIGDNAGRIILFKQQQNQFGDKKTFQYYSQFQSHVPQFDSLKSMTMSESITQIKWLQKQGKYNKMITSSNNSIKLWKMFQKVNHKVILTAQRQHSHDSHFQLPMPLLRKQNSFTSNCQIVFPLRHQSNINQVEISKNEEYLFSTDQQRALMWNFDKFSNPFIVQQINSKKYWKEGQKIACSKLHPNSENIFTIGTTKGRVQLNDLRTSVNNRKNSQFMFKSQIQKANDYFRQMTTKINSLQFLSSGKYIVSRDYLTIKIWDVYRTAQPVSVIDINPLLKQKMCHLFQNDCMEDQFQISSFTQNLVITGNYNNKFHIIDPLQSKNIEYTMDFDDKNVIKSQISPQKNIINSQFNSSKKVLACGVHRQSKKIALASLNSFFIYSPQKEKPQKMEIQF